MPLAEEARSAARKAANPCASCRPPASDPYYEVHLFETGQVQTRPDNRHDLFNALAWLAFPRTKARINAMHAAEIPRERRQARPAARHADDLRRGRRDRRLRRRGDRSAGARSAAGASCSASATAISRIAAWSGPRGAGAGARAASRHHLQGDLRATRRAISTRRPRDWLASSPAGRPATCRRCRCSAIRAGCRAAAQPAFYTTSGTSPLRCTRAVKSPRESARQPLYRRCRGKSGLHRAGCGLTPRRGDATNRATETSPGHETSRKRARRG